jgi:hypothetical protein
MSRAHRAVYRELPLPYIAIAGILKEGEPLMLRTSDGSLAVQPLIRRCGEMLHSYGNASALNRKAPSANQVSAMHALVEAHYAAFCEALDEESREECMADEVRR